MLHNRRQPTADSPVHRRSGAVLLEAMIALVILASAGIVVVSLVAESARAVERVHESESEMRAANAFFNAVALWSRDGSRPPPG